MGNSPYIAESNIFLDTGMKLEIAKMKHFKDKDLICLYLYGLFEETERHYLAELILNPKNQEIEYSHIFKHKINLVHIIPSNDNYHANVVYSNTDSLVYRNSETKEEFLIRSENKIYSNLFWPKSGQHELIGLENNKLEVIDIENDPRYDTTKIASNITNFDKLILDAHLLENSPFTNCICFSMNDSTIMIYDYQNKLVVDTIKTNAIVQNLSFNDINFMNLSCSEVNKGISHLYDFRKSGEPYITFRCSNINSVIEKQSWIPNHSKKGLITLNTNSNGVLFHNVDYSIKKVDTIRRYQNPKFDNDHIISDYFATDDYLLLQYKKEIEILSWKDALNLA